MTDPRHIRFSCLSTPRIEKQQKPKQVSEQFEILDIMESFYAILGGFVLLSDVFFGVPSCKTYMFGH